MANTPQQAWFDAEALLKVCESGLFQSITPAKRFEFYTDLYDRLLDSQNATLDNDEPAQLDHWRWQEKLVGRLRMVAAFSALDQFRKARS
jgi:hypothetical protein